MFASFVLDEAPIPVALNVIARLSITLCGPVANLLAFGFLNVRTGSQLFGF
jgi:hypothetical protein